MIFYADSLSNGIIISVFCRILISDAELTSFSGRKQEKVANNFFSSAIVFGTGKLVMSAVKVSFLSGDGNAHSQPLSLSVVGV